MKKNTWIKPEFEVETFVPNNYIAACKLILTPLSEITGWAWKDVDHDAELDGTYVFENGELSFTSSGDTWLNNTTSQQTLSTPTSQMELSRGQYQFVENAVLVLTDANSSPMALNAVTMNLEGERGMILYTGNRPDGNS